MKCKYKTIWITKEGKKVPIKKLSDEHLENIINYIDKYTIVEALNAISKKYRPDIWYNIQHELARRGK